MSLCRHSQYLPEQVLTLGGCTVAALAWSVMWSYGIFDTLKLAFLMIFRDYLLVGVVMATFFWYEHHLFFPIPPSSSRPSPYEPSKLISTRFFANRALLSPPSHSTPADTSVEWAYAFDVHTNAFFPLYLTLYLAQLFLVPIIMKNNWVCLWVGNTLYLAAYVFSFLTNRSDSSLQPYIRFAQYIYGIYLGLNGQSSLLPSLHPPPGELNSHLVGFLGRPNTALPFLIRTELLLAPLLPLLVGYIVSLLGFNVGRRVLSAYLDL